MIELQKFVKCFGEIAAALFHWWQRLPALILNIFADAWFGFIEAAMGKEQSADGVEAGGAVLRQMPAPAMPLELVTRIQRRVRVERAKAAPVSWNWRLKNRLQPFAFPATAGLLSAILFFAVFVRIFEVPVHAGSDDVPLQVRTPARLLTTALLSGDTGIQCLEVKLVIDQNGRVADYQILKGKQTPAQLRVLEYLLVFSVFDPATMFGRPTTDTVTLAVRDGHVKRLST